MQPKLTHIAKHVHDLDRNVEFFETFCGLKVVHERFDDDGVRQVAWMAEDGQEETFVLVFIQGSGPGQQAKGDYSHLGFALDSKAEVDRVAEQARIANCLAWEIRDEPPPVGYYCGVRDPEGQILEFSFGQPLGDPP